MAENKDRSQDQMNKQGQQSGQQGQKDRSFQQQQAGGSQINREGKRGLDTETEEQSENFKKSEDKGTRSDVDMDRNKKTEREANY